jgi:DNA-binding XRE family transcriptional regulator
LPGVKLPYDVKNNLPEHIRMEQARRMIENGGRRVNTGMIEEELADYCKVTIHAVVSYKLGRATPSLPVALKIARFFRVDVTKIFLLDDSEVF